MDYVNYINPQETIRKPYNMVQIYMLIGVLRVAQQKEINSAERDQFRSIQQKEINWNKIIERD